MQQLSTGYQFYVWWRICLNSTLSIHPPSSNISDENAVMIVLFLLCVMSFFSYGFFQYFIFGFQQLDFDFPRYGFLPFIPVSSFLSCLFYKVMYFTIFVKFWHNFQIFFLPHSFLCFLCFWDSTFTYVRTFDIVL